MRKQRSKALLGVLLVSTGAVVTAAPSAALPPLLSLSPIRLFPSEPQPAPAPPAASAVPAPPAPPPPPPPPPAPAPPKARPAPSSTAATPERLAKLRRCESGGNYAARSRSGRYYGAYQFSPATWRSLGYSGMPHEAPPHVQDEAARRLAARSGWSQWPACAKKMGLR